MEILNIKGNWFICDEGEPIAGPYRTYEAAANECNINDDDDLMFGYM